MKILLLGDIMGPSGREVISNKLPNLIKEKNINFVIANGENADDTGRGITEEICLKLFDSGVNVITGGNHTWDQKEKWEVDMVMVEEEKEADRVGFQIQIK